MEPAIAGTVAGVILGTLVAILVFGTLPPLNDHEHSILSIWMAVGVITGASVGGTGAIAAASRQDKLPREETADIQGMKYGRLPQSPVDTANE
jgi:hypothetical protein